MAAIGKRQFLVTEREGRLLRVDQAGRKFPISGTPDTLFAGQGGFFDIVTHPSFQTNQLVYLSYASGSKASNATTVIRARLDGDALIDHKEILRVTPNKITPQHYGARMLFLEDGTLIVTTGDGFEQREDAQSMNSELGKVLRVNEDGEPEGLRDAAGKHRLRIWTLGHRNPQGLALNPNNGSIFLHEHGPKGGDELNVLEQGSNYGWPLATHGVDYSGALVSPFARIDGMRDPIWTWVPSIAPSGMAWYGGGEFRSWQNSLFIGALVNKEVRRLEIVKGEVLTEESLFSDINERIRDVRVFGDSIYLLTDSEQGRLIRISP